MRWSCDHADNTRSTPASSVEPAKVASTKTWCPSRRMVRAQSNSASPFHPRRWRNSASVFSASTLAFSAGLTSGVGLSSFTVLVDFLISILPTTFSELFSLSSEVEVDDSSVFTTVSVFSSSSSFLDPSVVSLIKIVG